jgi:hypothetical protein
MNEPLSELVPRLERRVRFWRNSCFVLVAILLSLLTTGVTFFSMARQRELMAMERALRNEAVARKQEADAQAARIQAERALQEAKGQRKD